MKLTERPDWSMTPAERAEEEKRKAEHEVAVANMRALRDKLVAQQNAERSMPIPDKCEHCGRPKATEPTHWETDGYCGSDGGDLEDHRDCAFESVHHLSSRMSECRAENARLLARVAELEAENAKLREVGDQLTDLVYRFARDALDREDAAEVCRAWDAIERTEER